jgi:hypothetical protein
LRGQCDSAERNVHELQVECEKWKSANQTLTTEMNGKDKMINEQNDKITALRDNVRQLNMEVSHHFVLGNNQTNRHFCSCVNRQQNH